MKLSICALLIVLLATACCGAIRVTRDNMIACPRTDSPPSIDGRLDDDCWKTGPQIKEFVSFGGIKTTREQTSVSLAYDDEGFYIGFRCLEPEMSKLKIVQKTDVWMNDSVEVFIDSDRDRQAYCHFIVDAGGERLQETGRNFGENLDRTWDAPWDSAVAKSDGDWTAEIAIPWTTLNIKPRDSMAMRGNFGRNEFGVPEMTAWCVTPNGFHQPMFFGNIILGDPQAALSADVTLKPGKNGFGAKVTLRNKGLAPLIITPRVSIMPSKDIEQQDFAPLTIETGGKAQVEETVKLRGGQVYSLDILAAEEGRRDQMFITSFQVIVPAYPPQAIGGVLAETDWGTVWETCATFKVTPNMGVPLEKSKGIKVFSAKNEFEPFQIILTPNRDLKDLRVSVGDLVGPGKIIGDRISIKMVETVNVTQPTSADCSAGEYPDPLPPYQPGDIPAGRNTALWFTVHVPADVSAGDYKGNVTLESEGTKPIRIPVSLHVWNFALPEVSYLRTAYGHDPRGLCTWHGVTNPEDRRKVAELMNQDFIEHRIAPYLPMTLWEIDVKLVDGEVKADFTEFDKGAAKFLPKMNSYNLPFAWRSDFLGFKPGTPEYKKYKGAFLKQLAAHLKEKGWLDKGYAYIFDEPVPEHYPMLVEEAQMWRDAGLTVLLTEQPEKELVGAVDIWVPVLPNYSEKPCKERQAAGDEVWWYVCCGPHHPFPNNFIDYPALDHRILHWMNWKYGVTGVLYWSTQWWQDNPWTTPMSYTPDHSGTWGNGDGHLLYPAVKERSKTPIIAGPVDSIRWEMIREGVEDYDYFRMLSDATARAESKGGKSREVAAGKKALAEVDGAICGLTDYEKDPLRLYAIRRQVAEALEKLL